MDVDLRLMTWRRLEYIIGALIAGASFCVYLATLCPTVSFIDSGELATDVYTLGIPHPTGYPFFALVGHVFSRLPLGLRPIYQANLMAAIFCSTGLFFFFRLLVFILPSGFEHTAQKLGEEDERASKREIGGRFFAPAAATLILGFSETYWSQALSVEVYSVHLLFLSLSLLLFSKAIAWNMAAVSANVSHRQEMSYWMAFAFAVGLSFTNHMTTVLLAPAMLVVFFSANPMKSALAWRKLARLIVPFALGLSVYVYLPWRASMHPSMNWGNPVSLERFLWHVGGKQYRVWMFSSMESALKQFHYFITFLPAEFAYVPLLLAVIGLGSLMKDRQGFLKTMAQVACAILLFVVVESVAQMDAGLVSAVLVVSFILLFLHVSYRLLKERQILLFTILLLEACVLYSINYDIHDIDSYFLLAYLTVAIWSAAGIRWIMESIKDIRRQRLVGTASLAVALLVLVYNYPRVDESKMVIVEEYTNDMFKSVAPNGVVLTYQWDYFVSAAYYFQLVERVRPDIVVVDKELLRRSWYLDQLERHYPWLMAGIRKEADAYKIELAKFERGLPYNAALIEYRYAQLIKSIFDMNVRSRPIYVSPEIEQQYLSDYTKVPSGLLFRLYQGNGQDNAGASLVPLEFSFRIPPKSDKYVDGIVAMYAQAYLNYAIYSSVGGKKDEALKYVENALNLKSGYVEAEMWKKRILAR